MSETEAGTTRRSISFELARAFYEAHELDFQRAANAPDTRQREFEYSAKKFDDWAVNAGHMTRRADDCGDHIERAGAMGERWNLRIKINRVARKGVGLTRAFSIEANRKKEDTWRVVLGERFLAERPLGIMQKIGTNLHSQEDNIAATQELLENAEHLTQQEKMLHLMRLDTVGLYAFNCAQIHELVLQQAFNPEKKIDLRALRRKMADLMRGVKVVPPRRRPTRRKAKAK
jgi:hypothetical protein